MCRDRLRADHEPVGDLGLREPLRQRLCDLALPRGQAVEADPFFGLSSAERVSARRTRARSFLRHERFDDVVVGADVEAGDGVE